MNTKQENSIADNLYNKYEGNKIVFSSDVTKEIGLLQKETLIKTSLTSFHGVVLSTTFSGMVVMVKISDFEIDTITSNKRVFTIQVRFYDLSSKKTDVFTLFVTLASLKVHSDEHRGIYDIRVDFKRRIPDELIYIYSKFLAHKIKIEEQKSRAAEDVVEAVLCVEGQKQKCTAVMINETELVLDFEGNPGHFLNKKAIVILKHIDTGLIFEIIGKVRMDFVRKESVFSLTLNYSKDEQSPRFGDSLPLLCLSIN